MSSGRREKKNKAVLCVLISSVLYSFFFDLLQLILVVVNTRFDLSVFQSSDIKLKLVCILCETIIRFVRQIKKNLSKEKTHIESKEEEEEVEDEKEREKEKKITHIIV